MAPERVGFHASHEQLPPSALLRAVRAAEEAGFTAAMCSDHLAPWSRRQGHSGFAWSWLGAALQATSLAMGVVTAPVQRYHPAVIAQADLETPEAFEQAARFVRPEDVRESVLVSADLAQHAGWLNEIAATGADELHLHHVGKEQDAFIEAFGARVLPQLAGTGS